MRKFRITYTPTMPKELGGPWCLCGPRGFTLGFFAAPAAAVDWLFGNLAAAQQLDAP